MGRVGTRKYTTNSAEMLLCWSTEHLDPGVDHFMSIFGLLEWYSGYSDILGF